MPLRPNMSPQDFLEIFLRRKWLIIFSILFILFGASVYCVIAPEKYKSSTTILVVPQRVPENYVRSTVSTRIEDRLSTIQQQVLSRTRLSAVMNDLGLYKEERKNAPPEGILEKMRKQIGIQVKGNDSFTLSFTHENPKMAMLATSRLASLFIDENLKTREQQAVGTSEFLESQLKEIKKRLEIQEEKVRKYKMRYMGELPQQTEANLSVLRGLQQKYRSNAESIRSLEDRKTFLESQIASLERTIPRSGLASDNQGTGSAYNYDDPAMQIVEELATKKKQLADLSLRYTDRYPEILRLRNEVEQLESRILEVRRSGQSSAIRKPGAGREVPQKQVAPIVNPTVEEIRRLRGQVGKIELDLGSVKRDQEEVNKSIETIEGKVERAPTREQEMIALTRDYENTRHSYEEILRKKFESDIAQNLEKRQKGEQFQILDPADLPARPISPNRVKVFAVSFFLAFAVGFGGAIGLEMLDQTIRTQKEFRYFFVDLPVFAAIPILNDHVYARTMKYRRAVLYAGLISFTVAVAGFLLLYSERIRVLLDF